MKFRKLAAMAVCICMLLCVLPLFSYSRAYDGVAFLVINNLLQRPLKSDTMPVFIGSEVYIPYTALDALSTVKCTLNTRLEQLCIYNAGGYLLFDLANRRICDEQGTDYSVYARYINGTVYIPVNLTCDKFGLYHSVSILSQLAPMVRIHEGELVGTDADYTSRLYSLLTSTYEDFISSNDLPIDYTEYSPDTQKAHILFYGATDDAQGLFEALGSVKACFLLTEDEIAACGDFVRQAVANGHSVGFILDPASNISLTVQYRSANSQLSLECGLISRIAAVIGGSDSLNDEQKAELDGLGLRIWDHSVDAGSLGSDELLNFDSPDSADVFAFSLDNNTARALTLLLGRGDRYFAPIYEWTLPENRALIH